MLNIKITLVDLDVCTIKFGPSWVAGSFILPAVFASNGEGGVWQKYIDAVISMTWDMKKI